MAFNGRFNVIQFLLSHVIQESRVSENFQLFSLCKTFGLARHCEIFYVRYTKIIPFEGINSIYNTFYDPIQTLTHPESPILNQTNDNWYYRVSYVYRSIIENYLVFNSSSSIHRVVPSI